MAFDVPDGLSALLNRLGFLRTKKNPAHWWRVFDPGKPGERDHAALCMKHLKEAGLARKWSEVENRKPAQKQAYGNGFGGGLNARPIAGGWRMKSRHK
jgi:hypothetical protein